MKKRVLSSPRSANIGTRYRPAFAARAEAGTAPVLMRNHELHPAVAAHGGVAHARLSATRTIPHRLRRLEPETPAQPGPCVAQRRRFRGCGPGENRDFALHLIDCAL